MKGTQEALACSLPAVSRAQAQAEAHAERHFGDGRVADWYPASARSVPRPALRRSLGLASACGLALTAVVAGVGWNDIGNPPPGAPVAVAKADVPDDAPSLMLQVRFVEPPRPTAPALAPVPTLNITREGAGWRIEAIGASRLDAARRWAQASGSPVLGNVALLAFTRPLHLRWRGHDAADGWRAVLGSEVNFATQCSVARCRVWIVEGDTPGPAPGLRAASPAPVARPEVTAAALPGDSVDPRVAAYHD